MVTDRSWPLESLTNVGSDIASRSSLLLATGDIGCVGTVMDAPL